MQELWERAAFGVQCVAALAAQLEHDPTAPHVQVKYPYWIARTLLKPF